MANMQKVINTIEYKFICSKKCIQYHSQNSLTHAQINPLLFLFHSKQKAQLTL